MALEVKQVQRPHEGLVSLVFPKDPATDFLQDLNFKLMSFCEVKKKKEKKHRPGTLRYTVDLLGKKLSSPNPTKIGRNP